VADVIVSLVPVRRRCPSANVVVDRFDLWRNGAHALWLGPGMVEVVSVGETRGTRPWVVRPSDAERD
jgi:competence protein ComEC